ncbi:MAG: phosphoribosylanthranilate isomerase [Pseudomonadota bacterium]
MRDNPVKVKICGLTNPAEATAAAEAGADYIGLNFFPKSPRFVDPARAAMVAAAVPDTVSKVALVVNADDETLDELLASVPIDILQLHGTETPERVTDIRARTSLPVMKVLGIATAQDVGQIDRYSDVADQLLIDAKPPPGADRPGGNAVAFDWSLIAGRDWAVPWLLAGGLTVGNVAQAIASTQARQVDVASGVESAPGVKDPDLIRAFIAAARR